MLLRHPLPQRVPAQAVFHIVLNTGSGSDDAAHTRSVIETVLQQAGRRFEILAVEQEGPALLPWPPAAMAP